MARPLALVVVFLTLCLAPASARQPSVDWPQWRGVNRDGAALFAAPATWPDRLTRKWQVDVGLGYAAPIVVGDRVYAFSRQADNEVLRALNAGTGAAMWETRYPAPFKPNPAATRGHGTGPKATPTFSDGRLYTLGMSGMVTSFDAASGKIVWQTPAPPNEPLYHTAMSPLVDRGLVIVHVGGHNDGALTAFDARTGDVRWRWTGDGPAYGSPIVADLAGTRQVVTFTQENLVSVNAATGELLWKRPYSVRATRNAVTPILHGQTLIVSGLGMPVTAFRVLQRGGQWTAENVWENSEVTMDMSTGVVAGNELLGFSPRNSGQFFSLDANTGQTLWLSEGRQGENAAVVRAGDVWFALEDDGELVVARGSAKSFEVVRLYTVATSSTWAQPVLSGQRVFVKDVSSITLWTLN